jgi:two-component system, LytTR family, response regulator LytT
MKLLIIEDEDLAVKKLQKTIASIDDTAEVVGVAQSIRSSVEWLRSNPAPDLILMDIELADGQSFEIFDRVEVTSPVIFTTSYDEYAVKAFKVNSVDYLLKPIQKDELSSAMDKYRKLKLQYSGGIQPHPSINVELLIKELQMQLQPKEFRKRFLVKHANKMVSVDINDIAYFFSDNGLNFFTTYDNKKFLVDYLMDEIETMLDPEKYFRVSRSLVVTIGCIDKIEDYFGSRLILKLIPSFDKEALVSREKVADFKKWMGK